MQQTLLVKYNIALQDNEDIKQEKIQAENCLKNEIEIQKKKIKNQKIKNKNQKVEIKNLKNEIEDQEKAKELSDKLNEDYIQTLL